MKIGEFAQIAGLPISVLRHYDKEGLLPPDFIDAFTGYRNYSPSQLERVGRITLLKQTGISLKEIKEILDSPEDIPSVIRILDSQKTKYHNMLNAIEEVKQIMLDKKETANVLFQGAKPDGKDYWVYSWTKGYLKLYTGDGRWLSRYHIKEYQGRTYMFLEHKTYEYRRGGLPTTLVLEQLDHKAYTQMEIARKDNVDIPYERDERVLGDWKAVDYLQCREDFSPAESHRPLDSLFFKHMRFDENGEVTSLYGNKLISGKSSQSWTKGYVLRYWNHTACAYEIVTVDDVDYMIIEWKSGDYTWGGFDTDYYVFVREN